MNEKAHEVVRLAASMAPKPQMVKIIPTDISKIKQIHNNIGGKTANPLS